MEKARVTSLFTFIIAGFLGLYVIGTTGFEVSAEAGGMPEADATEQINMSDTLDAEVKLGGQLYDNWPKVTGQSTEGTHPLYPAASKKQGKSSWRCKECHGWDYLGSEGRYGKGSHYTGIKGLLDVSGREPDKLADALRNTSGDHDFSKWLNNKDINALARFLSQGLTDTRGVITPGGQVSGKAENDEYLFKSQCAACHGEDGQAIDFEDKKDGLQGVGWLANDNPQETLHKIRWGHPGTGMPSAIVDNGASEDDALNILRHARTLK